MVKQLLTDEKGVAMIVAIGIMLVITIIAFGLMAVSENDLLLSKKDKETMEALHVAEAGIHKALWQLEDQGNAMSPKTFSVDVEDGKADVNAVQSGGSNWYWTIESTGTVGTTRRKIKVTVFNFSLWNMNIGAGKDNSLASGGNGIVGTTSVNGPFYVRGNVQLSGNSSIKEGPLFIKTGSLVLMSNSATLGESGKPVEAFIEPAAGNGDIVDKSGNSILSKENQKQVYVSSLSNQAPDIKLPPLEPLSIYRSTAASESDEPVDGYPTYPGIIATQSAVSGYKVIDNDTNITGASEAKNNYVIDKNRLSFGYDASGNRVHEFAWRYDSANKQGKLTVIGTVFVDGNLTIGYDQNSNTEYTGRGTIVVNGDIRINGKLRPPYDAAKGTYDLDGNNVLGLVTDESIFINTSGSNSTPTREVPDVTGAFFATKKVKMEQNNTSFVGSLIAGVLDFAGSTNNSHLFTHDSLPSFLPPSLPGSTKYLTMTSSWREVN